MLEWPMVSCSLWLVHLYSSFPPSSRFWGHEPRLSYVWRCYSPHPYHPGIEGFRTPVYSLVPTQLWWITCFVLRCSWFLITILIQECDTKQIGNQGKETACVYLKHFLKLNSQCHYSWTMIAHEACYHYDQVALLKSWKISFIAIDEILLFGQI